MLLRVKNVFMGDVAKPESIGVVGDERLLNAAHPTTMRQ